MTVDVLALRLVGTVLAASGAWLAIACLCGLLRIRDPRIRSVLYGAAAANAVLTLLGSSSVPLMFAAITADPDVVHHHVGTWASPVVLVWWLGAGGLVTWRLLCMRRLGAQLRVLALLFPPTREVTDAVERAARRVGVRAPVVAFVRGDGAPFVASIRRPVLVLPRAFWERLDARGRNAMLLHELVHVRRFHHVAALVVELLRDVFFFNWPQRRLLARVRREWEALVDWRALRLGASRAGLARSLLATLGHRDSVPRPALALGGSDSASGTRKRLGLMARPPRRAVLVLQLLLLAAVLPWPAPNRGALQLRLRRYDVHHEGMIHIGLGYGHNPVFGRLMHTLFDRALRAE